MKKKTLIIIVVIVLALGGLITSFQNFAVRSLDVTKAMSQRFSHNIPTDYAELFKNNKDLMFKEAINSKLQNPVVNARYKKSNVVAMYKMGMVGDLRVDQIINEAREDRHATYDTLFWRDNSFYNLEFRAAKMDSISKIRLTMFGNDVQTLEKNDSVAYYYAYLKNYSIGTNGKEPQAIFWAEPGEVAFPTQILFIKRKKYLYLYLLSTLKNEPKISPYLLYDCVVKNNAVKTAQSSLPNEQVNQ